jgi:uncharacterized protein (TIGR00369 family)
MFPFGKLLEISVSEVNDDVLTGEMPVPVEICTTGEILQSGAVMALADSMGVIATFAHPPESAIGTTIIDRKTTFFRVIPLGKTALATSAALHQSRSTHMTHTLVHHR